MAGGKRSSFSTDTEADADMEKGWLKAHRSDLRPDTQAARTHDVKHRVGHTTGNAKYNGENGKTACTQVAQIECKRYLTSITKLIR